MRLTRSLQILGGLVTILLLLTAFTPLVNLLSYWRAPARPLGPAEAIVALGGGGITESGELSDVSLRRTVAAIELYRRGLAPRLALSGATPRETDARRLVARQAGVDAAAIVMLPVAHTTREEAVAARVALWPLGVRHIILVTDGPSMARSSGSFAKAGFVVTPSYGMPVLTWGGTPSARLGVMEVTVIELIASLYYRIRDWT